MPKKFQGENTKSAAARARRAEAKAAADARKHKELEDAYWKDEDKHVMRKEQRKEKEKRRLEQLERKKEAQRLLEEEDSKLKGGKAPRVAMPNKVTRAQIEETLRRDHQHKEAQETAEKVKSHLEVPLEENVNRRVLAEGSLEARTIEEAIAVLSVAEEAGDRHPERRMRAAFTAFEEEQLPRLKQENPNMRLSQLKQLLKKEWLRSPDNPMNQRVMPFNTPK
ncbi:PREDICTED: coiled-coil domain-containing protein 124 isoform X2 [Miniopterus natalensis]|uniref:coiled-coil domain-containing protein 124 isoform X2 n=1 Tax=Miniopterus natalensis TaxID=291302 RepID=UPI0007A6DE23|nr:PREDICTED: coiled-coil domain-containing protein 124 isoform X2 [Miniopterus natalensis]